MAAANESPVNCVGIVCFRGDEVLLIKRGKQPRKGQWSIPGGRIENGETETEACVRELMEETAVSANILEKIELIKADFGMGPYHLHDYLALWQSGEPVAGDDAADARFVPIKNLKKWGMWAETERIIVKGLAMLNENDYSKTQ